MEHYLERYNIFAKSRYNVFAPTQRCTVHSTFWDGHMHVPIEATNSKQKTQRYQISIKAKCPSHLDSTGKQLTNLPQAMQAASRTGQLSSLKQSSKPSRRLDT